MSQQPENTFIASVHKHIPGGIYRQKNHNQFHGGIPDVWYSGPAADLWVEYKFVALPKRENTMVPVELSELQKNWIISRAAEGRNVGVIIGSKDGGVWFPGTSWQTGLSSLQFRASIESRKTLAGRIIALVA